MSGFFKLDENIWDHPKTLAIEAKYRYAAIGLLVKILGYCSRHLTDGVVPSAVIESKSELKLAEKLISAGYLHTVPDGFAVHDYCDWNRSRADAEDYRTKKQQAGALGGRAKAVASSSKTLAPAEAPASDVLKQRDKRREEREDQTLCAPNGARKEIDALFERFWTVYPVKKGKPEARAAFEKAIKKADIDTLLAAVSRYSDHLAQPKAPQPKYAQGWLNGERWTDEYLESGVPDDLLGKVIR